MDSNIFYVYTYRDPEELLPFYVGKGHGRRSQQHMYHTATTSGSNMHKINKINKIRQRGCMPIIEYVAINLTEDEALELETQLIEKYGRYIDGGVLTNLCPTGHGRIGTKHTDKTKRTIGQKNTGQIRTEEQRKRIKEGCKRRAKPSAEARAKMSAAKQKMSQETKEKLRQIALNRPAVSDNTRAKLAKKLLGCKWYNNGVKNIRVFPGDVVPVGFIPGKIKTSSIERDQ